MLPHLLVPFGFMPIASVMHWDFFHRKRTKKPRVRELFSSPLT
jgi:hypothetical protein